MRGIKGERNRFPALLFTRVFFTGRRCTTMFFGILTAIHYPNEGPEDITIIHVQGNM